MKKTTAGKYKILPPLVKLFTREQPLYSDEKGTEALALLYQEHEKPLILIDSYAKVTAPLGIDEFKPEAANPIYDLMSAVAPYEATVVLIHHSSKAGQVNGPQMQKEEVMPLLRLSISLSI